MARTTVRVDIPTTNPDDVITQLDAIVTQDAKLGYSEFFVANSENKLRPFS